jgi:serine/threonine-protein kinase
MEENKYQIISTLATGGTAVLYKALQKSLDREVVIKRLHSHLTTDRNFTKRFDVEAKAAASLDHENIVRIIDSGVSKSNHFIVMEYISGMSLKEIMEIHGIMDEELALLIAHQICMGLDHAHQRGIIHRDIKPANIMITSDGLVKITDFGLAKLCQSQLQQTVADTLLGTPLYMSPEQAVGEGIDGRSDLFSLGTVCYEMVTGKQPFIGDNYAVVIQKIINGIIPKPSKVLGSIGQNADFIIMKALSREPSKRFSTALDMARTIESAVGQEKVLSIRSRLRRLVCGGQAATHQVPRPAVPGKKKRSKAFLIAAAAVITVVAGLWLGLDRDRLDQLHRYASSVLNGRGTVPAENVLTASNAPMPEIVPTETQPDTAEAVMDTSAVIPDVAEQDTLASPDTTTIEVAIEDETEALAVEEKPVETQPPPTPPPKPKKAVGFLDIQVEPEADILINGLHRVSATRYGPVEMPVGPVTVTLRQRDFRDYTERITIRKGELSRRWIELQRVTGSLDFNTVAGASVFVNGKFRGQTPLRTPILLPTGKYIVDLKKHGYLTWSGEVHIASDELLSLKINLIQRQQ